MLVVEAETRSPRLHVVRWRGDGDPDEASRTALAQLAASRDAGATILLLAPDALALPNAFEELVGGAPPIGLELDAAKLALHAPRGRGRAIRIDAAATGPERLAALATKEGAQRLEEAVQRALLAAASEHAHRWDLTDTGRDGKRIRTWKEAGFLKPAWLFPADPEHATAYLHSMEGGERIAARGVVDDLRVGRLARSTESFEVRPRDDGQPFTGFQLVLARMTAPQDRGALLRVELDDEDLGPWRLGSDGEPGRWSNDEFTISSTLLAGRERFRLAFTTITDAPIGSFQWLFLAEREPDGIWLTDLEPAIAPDERDSAPDRRRARTWGREWVSSLGAARRTTWIRAGERLEYALPAGYARFVTDVMLDGPTRLDDAVRLSVELDGREASALDAKDLCRRSGRLDVPLAGARTLTLALEERSGPCVVVLQEPELRR